MAVSVLTEVGPVGVLCGDAPVLHHELVHSPVLPAVTAVVPEAPGAVDQGLLAQAGHLASLEVEGALQGAHAAKTPAGAAD